MKTVGGLMMAAGGLVLLLGLPDAGGLSPNPGDVLDAAYDHDRTARVAMLREMDRKYRAGEFSSDADQAKWHNAQGEQIRSEAYQPYIDAVAEAIYADRQNEESRAVLELADNLDKE